MAKVEETGHNETGSRAVLLPVTVMIAAKNEAKNLPRCLEALRGVGQIYVIDSQSTDNTVEIARS